MGLAVSDVIEAILTVNCRSLAWDMCLRYPTEDSGDAAGAFYARLWAGMGEFDVLRVLEELIT